LFKVSVVLPEQVPDVWSHVEPWLQQVVDITNGRATLAETLNRCLKEDGNLWVIYNENDLQIVGAMFTKINDYPAAKFLTVEMLAGDFFDQWMDQANSSLIKFGQHFGCKGLELIGRRGWIRRLAELGWKEKFATCQLMFEGEDGQGFRE
jgi:hypothetical protein